MSIYLDSVSKTVNVDIVAEKTSATGCTVDGLLIKDSRWVYNSSGYVTQTKTSAYTFDADDCGHITFVDSSAASVTLTLPATVVGYNYTIVALYPSSNAINISPNSSDKIVGLNIGSAGGTDNKDYILATPVKGDFIKLIGDGVNGWMIHEASGTWTVES